MKKCAVYTRVSTSMQAEKEYNSCEAQKDKILSYVKSQENLEVFKEYSDPAFSGSNLERPALKALLGDIGRGQIEVVLTYKIDRLTRSSKDFYALIEFFEKHGVSFVSVTEQFDTASPSGRLLRNIMLTFAQFEREMTAERTRDKMLARAEKGLWNGGLVPLGYKREDGKLLVCKRSAKIVREIFETFVLTASLKKTMDLVKEKEWKSPHTKNPITLNGVFCLLRNPFYIGQIRWAKKTFQSTHEAIISKELFLHAQSLTKEKHRKKRLYKEYFLKRLLHCDCCGSLMTPTYSNKKTRRYYYYKCYSVVRNGSSACSIKEINAEKLENFLIENLSRIADDRQYIENLAFKMMHESPRHEGFELSKESEKNLATRISEVLMDFKNKMESATQVEKCLIFQKTIEGIKFSKDYLEVIVFIRDTTDIEVGNFLSGQSGKMAARIRAGAPYSGAPARTAISTLQTGDPNNPLSNLTLVLPHKLLDKTRISS